LTLAATAIVVPRLSSHRAAPALPVIEPARSQREPVTNPPPPQDSPLKTMPQEPPSKVVLPDVVKQVLPAVPAKARNTIRGKVTLNIRVGVDNSGSVVDVKNESPASSRFFANLALQAARQWKFAPANPNPGHSREWILRFRFVRDPQRPVSAQAIPDH
jgi:TonB family protein